MSNSVSFVIEGDVDTRITITEVVDVYGQIVLQFDVEVLDTSGQIGDLRALYFDIEGVDATVLNFSGDDITDSAAAEEGITTLGQDTNMKGSAIKESGAFDVGLEFGTMGIGNDDIQSTSFTLSLEGVGMSLEMLNLSDFGIRYTSVGEEGGSRDGSSKIVEVGGVSIARDDTVTTLEDETLSGNVLDNDSITGTVTSAIVDLDGDGVSELLVIGELTEIFGENGDPIGALTLNPDGSYAFVPAPDYNGDVPVVTYTVTNAAGDSSTASLTIDIIPVNDAPVAVPVTSEVTEDHLAYTLNLLDESAVTDVDGDPVTYVANSVTETSSTDSGGGDH